jgi:ABC-type phosphate transport system substrate-binding protein
LITVVTPVTISGFSSKIHASVAVLFCHMKYQRLLTLCAWAALTITPCFAHHMAVVVNKDVPIQNITSAHLAKIFKGEIKKWPDGKFIFVVLHRSSPGEMGTLEHLTKMNNTQIKAMVASRQDSIKTVESDAEVIDAVSSTSGAIGFVEEHSITDRVTVLRVDSKLPMESGYLPH